MTAPIRRIRRDEGLRLRALRLRALADAPLAFGSTLARDEAFPEAVWHARALHGAAGDEQVTYVAERGDRWVGLVTGLADDPEASGPLLVGMFVEPGERGRGTGVALVEAVTAWARERGAAHLYLWVTTTNTPALGLYRKCGFQPTGRTTPFPHAPSVGELEMVREVSR